MKIYYTRHGRTEWNEQHRFQGQTDIALNDLGIEQAEQAAQSLADSKIDIVLSSPLSRAHETACKIAEPHKIDVIKDDRLIERGYGDFEGVVYDTMYQYGADEFWSFGFSERNIEPMNEVFDRIENLLDELLDNHEDKNILLVSHGGIFRPISCYFDGFPESGSLEDRRLSNCEIKEYTIHAMGLQDKYFNFIKNGTKRIELRLNDEKRQKIKINDAIRFKNNKTGKTLTAKVIGLHYYQNFEEMFKHFDMELFADKSISKEEMLKTMEEFYPREKQDKIGVVGIEIEPISFRPKK